MNWIDISTPIESGMEHWPGDPDVVVERLRSIAGGDAYNLTAFRMSAHTGTHVDAPLHYLDGRLSVDQMPPAGLIGPAVVLDGFDLAPMAGAERLLFRQPELPPPIAVKIVRLGVKLVGVNSLSVGSAETHRILLGAGIWVVEGLQLAGIAPGRYELVCLPLRLAGADGAPARALIRPL